MSWLSTVTNLRDTAAKALGNSIGALKRWTGVTVSDADVDKAVTAAEKLAGDVEALVNVYLTTHAPGMLGGVAVLASHAVVSVVDSAIAGAGNVIKANN